jgi:hypothetical protein
VYQCCACGAETSRTQLVVQISETLIQTSRKQLQRSERAREEVARLKHGLDKT